MALVESADSLGSGPVWVNRPGRTKANKSLQNPPRTSLEESARRRQWVVWNEGLLLVESNTGSDVEVLGGSRPVRYVQTALTCMRLFLR